VGARGGLVWQTSEPLRNSAKPAQFGFSTGISSHSEFWREGRGLSLAATIQHKILYYSGVASQV
jgi:hypothetical protein